MKNTLDTLNNIDNKKTDTDACAQTRKIYRTPHLVCFGDVRSVTLGGSPGGGDSGSPGPLVSKP
jgi:hypothetical protein